MRNKEVLIQLLIEEINNDLIIAVYPGLCKVTSDMLKRRLISYDEFFLIRSCINYEIMNRDYPSFENIFILGKNSKGTEGYFFKPFDWETRKRWLKEVLENIKNDAK